MPCSRTAGLVAVALAEFAVAQRQVAVAAQIGLEDQHVARAVHRLERVLALLRLRREHVLAVVLPVARLLPQALVEDLRALDLLVARVAIDAAHVLLDGLPQGPALGMPEHHAGRDLVDVEQVEFLAEPAVVALLGFLDAADVVVELLLVGPGRAVDALQLLVLGVAAPVGAGQLRELEDLEETRVRHVRAAAHVDVLLVVVQAHGLLVGHVLHQPQLVVLAAGLEHLDDLVARRHLLDHVVVLRDQLAHARLDRLHVLGREGALVGNVVVEALVDHRADHHLRRRIELLHRVADQVGRRVADDFQALVVLGRDDLQLGVVVDQVAGIDQLAVDLAGHGHLREAGADGLGNIGHRNRAGKLAARVVGERDLDHGKTSARKQKSAVWDRAWLWFMCWRVPACAAYRPFPSWKRPLDCLRRSSRCHNQGAFLALVDAETELCDSIRSRSGVAGAAFLSPSTSIGSIVGGLANRSGAFAISAWAIGPVRCAWRPASSSNASKMPKVRGRQAQGEPDRRGLLVARHGEAGFEELLDLGFLAGLGFEAGEQCELDHESLQWTRPREIALAVAVDSRHAPRISTYWHF